MAKISNDNTYVTVEKGDTLSQIAITYKSYTNGASYQKLAEINGISNPNRIYVGQKIYFKKSSSGSSSGSSANTSSNHATNLTLGLLANSDNELIATWNWGKETTTDKYQIVWKYLTFNNKWLVGADTSQSVNDNYRSLSREYKFNIPDSSKQVALRVLPIAKNKKSNDKNKTETPEWKATWTDWVYYTVENPLGKPEVPDIDIDDRNKITVTLRNFDTYATHVVFEIVKIQSGKIVPGTTTSKIKIDKTYEYVSYSHVVSPGNEFQVRCKLYNGGLDSDWSDLSKSVKSTPTTPSDITSCKVSSIDNSDDTRRVYLKWGKVASADEYEIEYTTDKKNFDVEGVEVGKASTEGKNINEITIGKIAPGHVYYFRVRAVNTKGSSGWSKIKELTIGETPVAPTTWSSTSTVVVGETLKLYWIHNSSDGSSQTKAKLQLVVNGVKSTYEIPNDAYYGVNASGTVYKIRSFTDPDADKDKTSVCEINTTRFSEGVKLTWRVCTAGVSGKFDEVKGWSEPRDVDIYAEPYFEEFLVTNNFNSNADGSVQLLDPVGGRMNVLTKFPFYIKAVTGPSTQKPTGYHVAIIANNSYETVDQIGNTKFVNAGDQVYSKYFDISTSLVVGFSASNLDLENGINYTISCTASMNSGLSVSVSSSFRVSWIEVQYQPNAEITIDQKNFSASIRPYCEDYVQSYRVVNRSSSVYTLTNDSISEASLENAYTETGERVYFGKTSRGVLTRYCEVHFDSNGNSITPIAYKVDFSMGVYTKTTSKVDVDSLTSVLTKTGDVVLLREPINKAESYYASVVVPKRVENVILSVYRREYDGSFVEIATGIDCTQGTFVTDPHPALDYARYRIVATDMATGSISYYDMPGHPIGASAIILQWEESWSNFNEWSEDPLAEPTWTGSMVKLPYNVDVSNTTSPDVNHVIYIGRRSPVAYYGTHIGESATWNTVIPKDDKETIYALRRLAIWMGNVYVREPSGTGYWATVTLSMPEKHTDLTIPVTINITRTEGGM